MSIEVEDTAFDLDSVLTQLDYSSEKIREVKTSDVLLLPADSSAKESYFVDRAVSLKKAIEARVKVTLVSRQGYKHRYYAHRAADIILPVLIFLGWQAFDISKDVLASWLYEQMERFRSQKRKPNAKFSWVVIDEKKGTRKRLSYEGPAEPLPEILRNFKPED